MSPKKIRFASVCIRFRAILIKYCSCFPVLSLYTAKIVLPGIPLSGLSPRSQYPEHGFADDLVVRSRMFDACLVIDGGISYAFNDGATVFLSMHDEDSLRTVKLIDD